MANALPAAAQANTQTLSKTKTDVTQVVQPAEPQVNWNVPAVIAAGDMLSPLELNAASTVPGSFIYTPDAGTLLPVGTHTLYVHFLPTDQSNYVGVTQTAKLEVVPSNGSTFSLLRMTNAPTVVRTSMYSESTLTISATPNGNLYQAVHLSCDASPGVVCTFSPRDFRMGSSPVTVQVNVHVPAFWLMETHAAAGMLPLLGLAGLARRRRIRSAAFGLALTLLLFGGVLTGCGTTERFHVTVIAATSNQVRTLPLDLRQLGIEH